MLQAKLAISMDPQLVQRIDQLVAAGAFASRSQAIADAVRRQLAQSRAQRLADACALEDVEMAQALADEALVGEAPGPGQW